MTRLLTLFIFFIFDYSDCPCKHVHHSWRLKIIEESKTVTGVVKDIHSELDGDYHIKIRTNNFEILSKNNFKNEDSCLVAEIICAEKSIFNKCKNYSNKIPIPKNGDTIIVTGPYVNDWIHGIREIHPVIDLIIIKK